MLNAGRLPREDAVRVEELINYFETQYPGKKDLPYIQRLKGMCREWEADCLWGYFGWSGESVRLVAADLEAMKFALIEPGPRLQYVPDSAGVRTCIEYGKKIGNAINGKLK